MLRSMLINGKKKFYANDCANDLWIREVVFPGKRRGFFVEAGAADGLGGSSCFLLEKKLGWKGICIEPCEEFFHLLSQNRPKSIHVNACLARNAGTVDFVEAPLAGAITPYLSGVRDVLLRYKHEAEIVVEAGKIVPKQSVRLADLLDSHKAPREIEYGAFDIEGSEFEALRDFPFDRYRFLALSFEVDSRIAEPLSALLVQNNYVQTRNPFNQEYPAEQYWLHKSVADKAPAAYKASKLHDFRDSIHNVLESLAGRLSRVTSSKEYIPEIDGLRFIALISVLIFHSTIDFLTQRGWQEFPNYWSFGQGVILRTLGLGWLGVQTFFVISGFVVALPFARYSFASAPEPTLSRYFLRRVTRIEPPYILALIAMYFTFRPLAYYLPHLIAGLFYMHQFVFGTRNPINVVTWSLEVEIFFYILAPWLTRVYLIRKRTDRWMLQLALIACYSYAVEFLLLPHGPHRFRDSVFEFLPYFLRVSF